MKTKATQADVVFARAAEQAEFDFQQLVAQGIEPNPGPESRPNKQKGEEIRCVTLNIHGAGGIWKALEFLNDFDVITLQETCMLPFKILITKEVFTHIAFLGNLLIRTDGETLSLTMGPLLWLRTPFPINMLSCQEDKNDLFQTLIVRVEGWIVVNIYNPPRGYGDHP